MKKVILFLFAAVIAVASVWQISKARNALPDIINGLHSKGFQFVTVSELPNKKS